MSSNARTTNGSARRKLTARLRAEHRDCWICRVFGRNPTIDYSLPYLHPFAFTCDELIPVSRWREYGYASAQAAALDYSNVDAAHRCCNVWRGNKTVEQVLAIAQGKTPPPKACKPRLVNPIELEQPFDDW